MKILVLNCGSSSIKYALYNMDDSSVMTSGGAERVGLDGAFVKVKLPSGEKKQIMHDIPEHTEGVKFIFSRYKVTQRNRRRRPSHGARRREIRKVGSHHTGGD